MSKRKRRQASGLMYWGGGAVDEEGFSTCQAPLISLKDKEWSSAAVATLSTWALQKDAQMFHTVAHTCPIYHPTPQHTHINAETAVGNITHLTSNSHCTWHIPPSLVCSQITLATAAVVRSHIICSSLPCCLLKNKSDFHEAKIRPLYAAITVKPEASSCTVGGHNLLLYWASRWLSWLDYNGSIIKMLVSSAPVLLRKAITAERKGWSPSEPPCVDIIRIKFQLWMHTSVCGHIQLLISNLYSAFNDLHMARGH